MNTVLQLFKFKTAIESLLFYKYICIFIVYQKLSAIRAVLRMRMWDVLRGKVQGTGWHVCLAQFDSIESCGRDVTLALHAPATLPLPSHNCFNAFY